MSIELPPTAGFIEQIAPASRIASVTIDRERAARYLSDAQDVLVTVGVHSPKFEHEADPVALAADQIVEQYGNSNGGLRGAAAATASPVIPKCL